MVIKAHPDAADACRAAITCYTSQAALAIAALIHTGTHRVTFTACIGDRTTLRRATLDEPIVFGGAFRTASGPGVACLTRTGNLLVHSLPGLELLLAAPLQRALGFPFCAAPGGAGLVSLTAPPAAADEPWVEGLPSSPADGGSAALPKVLPFSMSTCRVVRSYRVSA